MLNILVKLSLLFVAYLFLAGAPELQVDDISTDMTIGLVFLVLATLTSVWGSSER